MKNIFLSKLYCIFFFLISSSKVFAQGGPPTKKIIEEDLILLSVAALLLVPIFMLAKTVLLAARNRMEKDKMEKNKGTGTLLTILFLISTMVAKAQPTLVEVKNEKNGIVHFFEGYSVTTWVLIFTIIVELIVVMFLAFKTVSLLKSAKPEKIAEVADVGKTKWNWKEWLSKKWEKMNNFKPIEKEADLDTGHNYDGIRELDNPAPGWFKAAFVISIIFALIYLYRFHVAKSSPLQEEEYNIAMIDAEKEHQEYLKKQGDNVDENNVKMLEGDDIASGKALYLGNCIACHAADGGGLNAPNLTDEYWIHGGGIKNIFKSVKYGWVEKGMKSWKDELTPKQMAQVSSYVMTLKGTKPAVPKASEGEIYTEEITPINTATVSVNSKIDTTASPKVKDTVKTNK